MTIPTYSEKINIVHMPSTSFKTLTVSWKLKTIYYKEAQQAKDTLVVFVTTKKENGAFVDQHCYKYQIINCRDRSTTATAIQNKQELDELKELKRMKEESLQADYDEKITSLLDFHTIVDIQCASLEKLNLKSTIGFSEHGATFHPTSTLNRAPTT